jgi:hypothetical protein
MGVSIYLYSAEYKGKIIDEQHFFGELWLSGSKQKYKVDAVFIKKAVNIAFDQNQLLPLQFQNLNFFTLYLKEEIIAAPDYIILRQIDPEVLMEGKEFDPDKCKTKAIWILNIHLKENEN